MSWRTGTKSDGDTRPAAIAAIRSRSMIVHTEEIDWFDRLLAVLFATVAVLGTATVIATVILYVPGTVGTGISLP